MKKKYHFTNNKIIFFVVLFVILMSSVLLTSYAFFNYTGTGDANTITTSQIYFSFSDDVDYINIGNAYPISENDIDQNYEDNFSITAHNNLPAGVRYTISIVPGDTENEKIRFLDEVMSVKLEVPDDGDGFITGINNYGTFKSPVFVDGKALLATGIVKNTSDLTTKNFKLTMFLDSSKIHVSSTTKRVVNAEGNPSLADATSGKVTEGRYIENDNNLVNTVLYPARGIQEGKIIYTTKEYKNSYYSVKIVIEAYEVKNNEELVYLDTNGGSLENNIMSVTLGEKYPQLPTPTREGYTFLGWNGKNKFNFDIYSVLDQNLETVSDYRWKKIELDGNKTYKVGIYYKNDFDGKINNLLINTEKNTSSNWTAVTHTITPNSSLSNFEYSLSNNEMLYIGYDNSMTQTTLDTIIGNTDVQIEEGTEATAYEPYYVTNNVAVTQAKDHVLKAIWQKNNG